MPPLRPCVIGPTAFASDLFKDGRSRSIEVNETLEEFAWSSVLLNEPGAHVLVSKGSPVASMKKPIQELDYMQSRYRKSQKTHFPAS
jgi:hypothetical protein